jgi:DNA-binding transcriptional ArsR family regulator
MAQKTGAAVVVAHHFAKGDSTAKNAMDRMSGAGAWARDPDSIMVLTPHEEDGCFTVTSILRNLPQHPEFVLAWDYPLMRVASDLNPDALRRPQAKNKVCSDKEFIEQLVSVAPISRGDIVAKAAGIAISRGSVDRYLKRLTEAGLICSGGGLYWRKTVE